jgi:hypothetical protein
VVHVTGARARISIPVDFAASPANHPAHPRGDHVEGAVARGSCDWRARARISIPVDFAAFPANHQRIIYPVLLMLVLTLFMEEFTRFTSDL